MTGVHSICLNLYEIELIYRLLFGLVILKIGPLCNRVPCLARTIKLGENLYLNINLLAAISGFWRDRGPISHKFMNNLRTLSYLVDDLPLSKEDIPRISELNRLLLDHPFTEEELHSALKSLNKNKSPGSDGITPEFYLKFWDLIRTPFVDSIFYSLENGILSEGQRTGLIKLIPKKDLDRLEITNWRPITLLNVDFKVLSKAIAGRIQSCINQIKAPDQTGFMRAWEIGSNLVNTHALMDHVEATDITALLLMVDYKKLSIL